MMDEAVLVPAHPALAAGSSTAAGRAGERGRGSRGSRALESGIGNGAAMRWLLAAHTTTLQLCILLWDHRAAKNRGMDREEEAGQTSTDSRQISVWRLLCGVCVESQVQQVTARPRLIDSMLHGAAGIHSLLLAALLRPVVCHHRPEVLGSGAVASG